MVDKAFIGREAEGATITIKADGIREFAKALGETDPIYFDKDAAVAAGYRDIVAPPTYPIAFMAESMNADLFFELNLNIPSLVHGGQEFIYSRPVQAGDELKLKGRVADIWEKKGRTGTLDFVVMEAAAYDPDDKPVYTSRITLISRRLPEEAQESANA